MNLICKRTDCFANLNQKCTCLNSTYFEYECPFYKNKQDYLKELHDIRVRKMNDLIFKNE